MAVVTSFPNPALPLPPSDDALSGDSPNQLQRASVPQSTSVGWYTSQTRNQNAASQPNPGCHSAIQSRTRAIRNEICFNYLFNGCQWGFRCHRLHPIDKRHYKNQLISSAHAGTSKAFLPPSSLPLSDGNPELETESISCPVSELPPPYQPTAPLSWEYNPIWDSDNTSESSIDSLTGSSTGRSTLSQPAQPHLPPKATHAPGICLDWLQGRCRRGYCKYKHGQIVSVDYQADVIEAPLSINQLKPSAQLLRPAPLSSEVCKKWLRGYCCLGYDCKYVHNDLEYDRPLQAPMRSTASVSGDKVTQTGFSQLVTLRDHIVVKLDAGFEVLEVSTGFDTPWLSLDHVPAKVNPQDLRDLLETFGTVLDIKFPKTLTTPHIHVKAKFASATEAHQALALDGASALGSRLNAHLPLKRSIRSGGGEVDGSTVRVEWEYPSRTVYCGYPSLEQARKAMQIARQPWRDMEITAELHTGHPVLGIATVRFRNMPAEIHEEELAHFAEPSDFMWERPTYNIPIKDTIAGLRARLEKFGSLATFEVQQAPYRYGTLRAWARYSASSLAQKAVEDLHKRKPQCTGFTRIVVQQLKAISYRLPSDVYTKVAFDIRNLATAISLRGQQSATSIRVDHQESVVSIKIRSADLKILGQLKRELERILHGEIVYQGGRVAWDNWFLTSSGINFLASLEHQIPGTQVKRLPTRRCIQIFGSSLSRTLLKREILQRLEELNSQTVRTIRVNSRIIGILLKSELLTLEMEWGADKVSFDLALQVIQIRGNDRAFNSVIKTIRGLETLHHVTRLQPGHCPVCLGGVISPVSLPCQHVWCRSCIVGYLNAASSNRFFPLTCLGNEAKCQQKLSLGLARDVLSPAEFDILVEAAFTSYLHSHPDEFHYCPTPDCQQIYRVGVANSPPLQCPSCLVHICSFCHIEYHQDFQCRDDDNGDELFRAWMEANNVKKCPGCKVPIEKAAGCNHMACTQCHTHLCWVCMKTFTEGQGIYDHMRTEHGGIGDVVFL